MLLLIFLPSLPFSLKRYKVFKKRVEYIDDYNKVKVKVDSVRRDLTTTIREGDVEKIYYSYKNVLGMVTIDEDAKNDNYKHFLNGKQDSIYIWHNPKADDLYTIKESKPLSLKYQKYSMYRDLFFVILGVILTLWFIYIMFIEKKKINDKK
ncbi:hypothetical protein [Tenacibaculum litoreum]|uniref:hypothetical protein n=1 Tax=Tenacibaculum litoreum TaxID=321269 RepID=UPI0038B524BF